MKQRPPATPERELSPTDDALLRYVDDRLDIDDRNRAENLLRENREAAQRVATWQQQDAILHKHFDPIARTAVPQHLLRAARRAAHRSPLRYAAAVVWLSIGLLVGWLMRYELGDTPPAAPQASLSHIAAMAHAIYVPEKRHAVEVAADEEAHLVTWLSKRLGQPLKVPVLNAQGYALVGGRLLPSETGPVAQFMFQNDAGQRLTLYLRTQKGNVGETSFQFAQEGTISTFYWLDDQLSYALSGDIARDKLLALAQETYRQLNP
ncbi:anti-sigma factor [Uliginosibacterium sediminicola]|uniref:Anti-sigma factor n=1 Tax=Uliginosibacterium sediminicola TaxID=2024550 RepID=A0ABU9Z2B9_9RHOO